MIGRHQRLHGTCTLGKLFRICAGYSHNFQTTLSGIVFNLTYFIPPGNYSGKIPI